MTARRPGPTDQEIKDLIDRHQQASYNEGWRAGFCSAAVAVLVPLGLYALYLWVNYLIALYPMALPQ